MDRYIYSHKVTTHPNYNETSLHKHDMYEIFYFESGSAELVCQNGKVLLFPGALLLIPPYFKHKINITSDMPYTRSVINFTNPPIKTSLFESQSVYDITKNDRIISVFDRLKDYDGLFLGEQKEHIIKCIITELLLLLQKETVISTNEYGLFMTTALEYIDRNITELYDVKQLCDALHISQAYLYREFKNTLDISPMKYINQKRLLYARDLIRLGEDSTKVCFRTGFGEYSAFYRAYKSFFGYSPSQTPSK